MAIAKLTPTAIRFVSLKPSAPAVQNPAVKHPTAAPSVFRQYNAPIREPINRRDSVTARASKGSVVPIKKQGTTSIAKDNPNRASVLTNKDAGDNAARRPQQTEQQRNRHRPPGYRRLNRSEKPRTIRNVVRKPASEKPPKPQPRHIRTQNDTDGIRAVAENRHKLPAP
ncbi:MAG: hypothetical protein ABII09_06385 [Planctomycetota bacterium]